MPNAVIFDVDGTLIDSVDLHAAAWVETFRHFGLVVSHGAVRSQIGKGGDQLMPVFVPRDLLERRGGEIEAFRADLFKRDYLSQARAFPGVRALFERIRTAGQTVVLASSGKADEVERYQEIAGIADLVQAVTTSDDAERSKPHPDIFEAALAALGDVQTNEVIVVGDTPYDAEAAGKAGLKTVGLLSGGFPKADLRAAGCVSIYRDPADLLANYDSSPLAKA
jgi:HAD superfamily hydrolase (TIGR01509 family)